MSSPSFKLDQSRVYRAGAGAGKTTRLVEDVYSFYHSFLKQKGRAPRIILTTFTKKATQELKERLSVHAIEHNDFEMLKRLSHGSSILISTIHGVLSVFLRRQSQLLGLDSEFKIENNSDHLRRLKQAIRKTLAQEKFGDKYLELINRYEFSNIVSMVEEAYPAILSQPDLKPATITDQRKSLQAILSVLIADGREVSASILEETTDTKWVEAAFIVNGVIEDLESIGLAENICVKSKIELIVSRLKSFRKPSFKADNPNVSSATNTRFEIWRDQIKDLDRDANRLETWKESERLATLFFEFAEAVTSTVVHDKLENGVIATEDLEVLTRFLIRRDPKPALQFQSQWDYWFIDEYQDTSPLQVELLQELVGPTAHYIVGDPQQSIYFFRGARSQVFENKRISIEASGGISESLQNNYRSQPKLLEYFNWFFQDRKNSFSPMVPMANVVSVPLSEFPVEVLVGSDSDEESVAVRARIVELLNAGVQLGDISILARRRADLRNLALILDQADIPCHVQASGGFYDRREVLDALALLRFCALPSDDSNLIRLLRSPWCVVDDSILVYFRQKFSSQTLWTALVQWKENPSSHDIEIQKFNITPHACESARVIITRLCTCLESRISMSVSSVFRLALVELGFFAFCHKHDVTGQRESNIWKIVQKLKEAEHKPNFNFHRFLRDVEMGLGDPTVETNDNDAIAALEPTRVTLMTVHASKGLQFQHVIVPYLNKRPMSARSERISIDEELKTLTLAVPLDGATWVYPPSASRVTQWRSHHEAEEVARLLYVAMTRARHSLTLTFSGSIEKGSWGELSPMVTNPGTHDYPGGSYRVRNSDWFLGSELEKWVKPSEPELHVRSQFIQSDEMAGQTNEVSVTALAKFKLSELDFQKSMSPKQALAISNAGQRGIVVHRILERLFYEAEQDVKLLSDSSARREWVTKNFNDTAEVIATSLDFIFEQTEIPMIELFKVGHSEWPFTFLRQTSEVKGQIDLWGVVSDTLWIVDYKTGRTEDIEIAFRQLELYAEALRAFGVTEKVALVALYPTEKFCSIRNTFQTQLSINVDTPQVDL